MKLTNVIPLFLVFTFTVTVITAQTDSTGVNLKGKYALQFQITDFLKFADFNGGIFSSKYYFTNNACLRTGFEFRYNEENSDKSIEDFSLPIPLGDIYYPNSEEQEIETGDRISKAMGLSVQFILSNQIKEELFLYYGLGPFVEYKYLEESLFVIPPIYSSLPRTTRKITEEGFTYGVDISIGAEWFFIENMSLSLEHKFKMGLSKSEIETSGQDEKDKWKKDSKFFDGSTVLFGLSIYL